MSEMGQKRRFDRAPPANLTPYAAVQAQSFRTLNFSEGSSSGSNVYALSYASHTGSVTRAELGS
jgi:hypothetical protein